MIDLTRQNFRKKKPLIVVFFGLLFIAFIALVIGVVMTLWNAILPDVLGVKSITFWQAAGILLLSKILFGGLGSGRKRNWKSRKSGTIRNSIKNKWMKMNPEERNEMKSRWQSYCQKKDNPK